jgi:hypothetical protein
MVVSFLTQSFFDHFNHFFVSISNSYPHPSLTSHYRRYHFTELHTIDWIQFNTSDPDQDDLWTPYLPSVVCQSEL